MARALYQKQAEIRGKVEVRTGGFGQKDQSVEEKASQVGDAAAVGCCWLLLPAVGGCWLLLASVDCCTSQSDVWASSVVLVSVSTPGFHSYSRLLVGQKPRSRSRCDFKSCFCLPC
jgi:hypothetical protein